MSIGLDEQPRATGRKAAGFEEITTWDEVRASAATDAVLWYWGAMDFRPHRVLVMKLFKNGKIRVDPTSNASSAFTLDPGHLGLVYRRIP